MTLRDRRDYGNRAATLQRLLERLLNHRNGARTDELQDDHLPGEVVERILKQLAIRGLVAAADWTWRPTPPLIAGSDLQMDPVEI